MKKILDRMNDIQTNFSKEKVEKIIKDFEIQFENNTAKFVEAINKDYKKYIFKTKIEELREIIKGIKSEPIEVTETISDKCIKDGYGNIVVTYNGRPTITLTMVLKSIITHNKILLCEENKFEVNKLIIDIMKQALKNNEYNQEIINLTHGYQEISCCQDYIDKVIFIGNKYDYINLRKKLYVETEYNGYGYISLYYDNDEYLTFIENMKMYSLNNLMEIDIYNGKLDEAIEKINYLKMNQTAVIFSKEKTNLVKWILNIKANEIYVNKNPLANYKFVVSNESLLREKDMK